MQVKKHSLRMFMRDLRGSIRSIIIKKLTIVHVVNKICLNFKKNIQKRKDENKKGLTSDSD